MGSGRRGESTFSNRYDRADGIYMYVYVHTHTYVYFYGGIECIMGFINPRTGCLRGWEMSRVGISRYIYLRDFGAPATKLRRRAGIIDKLFFPYNIRAEP